MNEQVNKGIISIQFSDDIDTELSRLSAEMRIFKIIKMLASDQQPTEEMKADIRHLMLVLADLFSSSVPPLEENPIDTLLIAARDIQLSRLLRERGLVRLYRLVTLQIKVHDELTDQDVVLPAFMTEVNPETGVQFKSQEEFIGWFCKNAHVPRSLVFLRIAAYDRMLGLGMSLEEAFEATLKKPSATSDALRELAVWQGGEMVDINPDVAVRLTRAMLPEKAQEVEELTEALSNANDPTEAEQLKDNLIDIIKPAMRKMVHEVSDHPSVRDAMDMVRHDIVAKPEIKYWFDVDHQWIEIEYIEKKQDVRGTTYISNIKRIPLMPETPLPHEVLVDLSKRLNFKNRDLVAG